MREGPTPKESLVRINLAVDAQASLANTLERKQDTRNIIILHSKEILNGSYTLENLLSDSTKFKSLSALNTFLFRNFGSYDLKKIMTHYLARREAPNANMQERMENADIRKSEISRIIRENMEKILSGEFAEEDLINYPLNFKSKKAVTAFLSKQFLAHTLKEIAIGIKTLDYNNVNAQKTAETTPLAKPVEIKMDKEALTARILSEYKPKMSTLALARRLRDLIDTAVLPAEAELCKIFNVKALRELSVDMVAKWQLKNLK